MRALVAVAVLFANCPPRPPSGTDPETFACEELTCEAGQVCVIGYGGAPPPEGEDNVHPSCVDAPAACAGAPTCECVVAADLCPTGPADCDESGEGVVCSIYYP
jgi:hypothetical protein